MRSSTLSILAICLVVSAASGASAALARPSTAVLPRGDAIPTHTQRKVLGVITAVEAESLTIDCSQTKKGVRGRLAPETRLTLNGKPARAQDLHIAFGARGEMNLDDEWVSIAADSK